VSTRSRHVRLTRRRVAGFWLAPAAPGRCVYQLLQPTYTTSTLVIARFSNHRSHGFRRRARLPRRLPGRNLGRQHDRAEPRLTPRLKLRQGRMNVLGLPGIQAPPGPDELLAELSGRRSFLSALSALSEGHRPASDALCRAPAAGLWGFDAHHLRDKSPEGRLRPRRRQALRSSPAQSAFHRRDTRRRSLARCFTGRRRRFLQPWRSTSTASDHLKPRWKRRYITSR
jgi:hypothetical protein